MSYVLILFLVDFATILSLLVAIYILAMVLGRLEKRRVASGSNPLVEKTERDKNVSLFRWVSVGVNLAWIFLIMMPLVLFAPINVIYQIKVAVRLVGLGLSLWIAWRYYIYTRQSFWKIEENRLAILLLFGKFVMNLSPGLVYAPKWACDVIHTSTEQVERDLPDEPAFIYHGDPNEKTDGRPGDGKIPEGYTPALRVTLAEKTLGADEDFLVVYGRTEDGATTSEVVGRIPRGSSLLLPQNVEWEGSYSFVVEDLLRFYRKIGNKDRAVAAMDDHVISSFESRLKRYCPGEVNLLQSEIAREVQRSLAEYTEDWGIQVRFAKLKSLGFSHAFNKQMSAAAGALETKRATITASEGERDSRINKGKGDGEYERQVLVGTAAGQKELIAVSMTDGGRTQAIQAIGDALKEAELIVAPNDNLLSAVAGVGAVLRNLPGTPTPTDSSPSTNPTPSPATPTETLAVNSSGSTPQNPHQRKNRGKRRGKR